MKDTVLSGFNQETLLTLVAPRYYEALREVMEEQYKRGIKEVVDWIQNNIECIAVGQDVQTVAGNNNKYGQHSHIYVRWLEWQAKLKEWDV